MLVDKIINKENGLLFYGLTPPKLNQDEEKLTIISQKQKDRIKNLSIDGLILYDIQDEASRTNMPRPFPFMQTLAPDVYSEKYLSELEVPKIIYKSVGKFNDESLREWLKQNEKHTDMCVFVGAPSKDQKTGISLRDAYKLHQSVDSSIVLGGVTIPERHQIKADEHIRVANKIDNGCKFFVSQCVYNITNAKNFLSDYYYYSVENNLELMPIIFTLTPCGSLKTLQFMEWLGIDLPQWLKNELSHSENILDKSLEICKLIASELVDFSKEKNIPIGFNIESVAIRKQEIDASIDLLNSVKEIMNR